MTEAPANEPSAEDLRRAPVLPGFELPDSVTLHKGVVLGAGLQPEDVGVLGWLKLRDPRLPATQEDLAREMQDHGWKMGKTRFAGIFQRLKASGHIKHRSTYNPATGRPEWRIEFFMNPANNDQYVNSGISAFPQAGAESLVSGDSQSEHLFETPETSVSPGQKESRVSGDSLGIPGNRGFGTQDVPAGQGRNSENRVSGSHPPHPPEEEDSSSPTPPTRTSSGLPSQREEGEAEFSSEEITAAEVFLQQMKRWQAGAATARKCAPRLLRTMRRQGWPELAGATEEQLELLEAEILKNTARAMSWTKCLPGWVDDLRLYERARFRAGSGQAGGRERCPEHPRRYREGCPDCAMAVPA